MHYASRPISIHLLVLEEDKHKFNFTDQCQVVLNIVSVSREEVDPYINKHVTSVATSGLMNPYNYMRYIAAGSLPGVNAALVLDADILVTADVANLMQAFEDSGKVVGAFPRKTRPPWDILTNQGPPKDFPITFQHDTWFCAGFIFISFHKWRSGGWGLKMKDLVAQNDKHKWWTELGSQPPLNAYFGGDNFYHINNTAYQYIDQLGHHERDLHDFQNNSVYHWNGDHKFWKPDGYNKKLGEKILSLGCAR